MTCKTFWSILYPGVSYCHDYMFFRVWIGCVVRTLNLFNWSGLNKTNKFNEIPLNIVDLCARVGDVGIVSSFSDGFFSDVDFSSNLTMNGDPDVMKYLETKEYHRCGRVSNYARINGRIQGKGISEENIMNCMFSDDCYPEDEEIIAISGIVIGRNDNIYVASHSHNMIRMFTPSFRPLKTISDSRILPYFIASTSDGRIIVRNHSLLGDDITFFTATGQYLNGFSDPSLNKMLLGLCVNSKDEIIIGDNRNQLRILNGDLSFNRLVDIKNLRPMDFVTDLHDNIVISDTNLNICKVVSSDGDDLFDLKTDQLLYYGKVGIDRRNNNIVVTGEEIFNWSVNVPQSKVYIFNDVGQVIQNINIFETIAHICYMRGGNFLVAHDESKISLLSV
jgi:hypothetical protein